MNIKIIIIFVIITLVSGLSIANKIANDKVAVLTELSQQQQKTIEEKNNTINAIVLQNKRQVAAISSLADKNISLNNDKLALAEKLAKHDLEMLSRLKPVLVERVINNATEKIFNDFHDISTF